VNETNDYVAAAVFRPAGGLHHRPAAGNDNCLASVSRAFTLGPDWRRELMSRPTAVVATAAGTKAPISFCCVTVRTLVAMAYRGLVRVLTVMTSPGTRTMSLMKIRERCLLWQSVIRVCD
jgi:hypothetical protein